jgi:phosphoribosylglycinamide formyltransferase 1
MVAAPNPQIPSPPEGSDTALVSPDVKRENLPSPPSGQPLPRLGILASGSGSNFEAIAQSIALGHLQAEIPLVIYNNPGATVVARADRWGVPTVLLNHRDFAQREDLDRAIAHTLQQYQVQWVIMAGWMRIVTPILIEAFPQRLINIHPSLLPSFKGTKAVEQALAAGVKITGCTVHLVVPEVDSGPILMQAAVPIFPHDTPATLHQRIQVQEHRIFPAAIAAAIAATA